MIRTENRMRLCLCLLAVNLAFIWGNSLMPGALSQAFSDWVKAMLAQLIPSVGSSGSGGFVLRKLAHFSEFAALGALLGWLCAMLGRKKPLPFLLGAAAACIDETIQCFVPGRGPALRDVGIDCGGVLTGLCLLWLGHFLVTKHRSFGG